MTLYQEKKAFYSVIDEVTSKGMIQFLSSSDLVYMGYKTNTMKYYES